MSSLKMTFSLTSLIFLIALGLVFVPMSVMAAPGGPTVTITDNGTTATPTTRSAFQLKFTFSEPVDGFANGEAEFRDVDKNDNLVSGTNWSGITIAPVTGNAAQYTASIDVSNLDAAAVGFRVRVPADSVNSLKGSGLGNQLGSAYFGLPPILGRTQKVEITAVKATADTDATDGQDYTVTFKFKGITTAPTTALGLSSTSDGNVAVTPDYVTLTWTDPTAAAVPPSPATPVDYVYTSTVTHPVGAPSVTIGLASTYVASANVKTATIPLPAAPTPPTATLTVSAHDATARTFRVDLELSKDHSANLGILDLMIKDADDVEITFTVAGGTILDERATKKTYTAILKYGILDKLPLKVTTASGLTLTGDAPVAGVGGDPVIPPPAGTPTTAPSDLTAPAPTGTSLAIALSWTALTDTGITGYEVKVYKGDTVAAATAATTAAETIAATGTSHTYMAVAADRGKYFAFTVAGVNASGTGVHSAKTSPVRVLPPTPVTDTTPPTVEIEVLSKDVNGKHELDPNAFETVRFKLTFSEPLAKANAVPGSISQLELEDFTIQDHNGTVLSDATQNPINASLSAHTAEFGGKESYILTVPTIYPTSGSLPDDRPSTDLDGGVDGRQLEVHIRLRPRTATDVVGNPVPPTTQKFDTIPPKATIYPGYLTVNGEWISLPAAPVVGGVPRTSLTFLFVFSEKLDPEFSTTDIHRALGDNFTLETNAQPRSYPVRDLEPRDFQIPEGYLVTATIVDKFKPTTVLLKREEVADEAKNLLQEDEHAAYLPSQNKPVVVIKASDIFNCGVPGNHVEVIITDAEAIKAGESITEKEITVSKGWKIKTGTFTSPKETAAGAKEVRATFNVIRKDVESPADRSWLGEQAVTITVAADAIKDDTDQGHDKKDETYTAGPVIDIPAGAYVVVVRTESWVDTHLQKYHRLYLGDYNVRASLLDVWDWNCMPDLGLIFDVTTDASPGIGGGGLMVMQSRKHVADPNVKGSEKIKKGTVGISEIMWSEDRGLPFGFRSNIAHAQEQWIELHNTNNFEVKVTLFDLIRTEAYRTNDVEYEKIGMVDIMSNYDIGGRWDVQKKNDDGTPIYGSDGNSERGYDFISMQRKSKDKDHEIDYSHNDYQGRNQANWSASPYVYLTLRAGLADRGIQLPNENLNYDFRGSPARSNAIPAPGPITKTKVPKNSIVFNEIANRRDQTLEWIELKNVSADLVNLKNYQISIVTEKGKDEVFYTFPNNDNTQIAPGELLLLVDTDPRDNDAHTVAVGYNIHAGNDQALGIGENPGRDANGTVNSHYTGDAPRYMVTNFAEGGLPNDGEFVLLLRNGNDKRGTHEKVIDLVGWDDDLKDTAIHTDLWPLQYFGVPDARNKIEVETVHRRQHLIDPDQNTHGDDKDEHQALRDVGYTGVGYKRHAQRIAANGGTPGTTDTRKNLVKDIEKTGVLTISEIMFDQGDGNYPQWIEIYNSSDLPVNLHSEAGWRLIVENYDDGEIAVETLSGTLNFKNSDVQTILPKQTVMVTSTRARNSGSAFFDTRVIFPATRVFSVWDDQRGELTRDRARSTEPILSEKGFYIELIDGKGNFSDGVGNLVKSPNRRVASTIEWELSDVIGEMMAGIGRSSIIRRYREFKNGKPVGVYSPAELSDMGLDAAGWIAAHKTKFLDVRQTWYGHGDDVGSPGITAGGVLPVSLSKFRPERMKDTGEIVVRWITESELNNAGFNILRSEKRDGEFTKVHYQAGQGTTTERTVYEWKDKSAKPNVVYYYQIQDVSLDGQVTPLRITHLRGNVTAAGKATTTWGEIKALQ